MTRLALAQVDSILSVLRVSHPSQPYRLGKELAPSAPTRGRGTYLPMRSWATAFVLRLWLGEKYLQFPYQRGPCAAET